MFRALRPYQLVVDLVVAGLFALVMVPYELYVAFPENKAAASAAALMFAAALGVRRLAPGLALGAAWLAAIVQMAFLLGPRPVDVVVFAVLYAAAAYGSRLEYWLGLASAGVGALVITVYLFAVQALFSFDQLTTALAVLIAATFALLLAWVTGALVRTAVRARETRRAQQAAEAEAIAEQERVRIARDMHDVVAHSLAVVIAQADGARYAAASDPAATATALATISGTARSALADVRLLLTQLRHSEGAGPQPTLADLEELYAGVRAAGVELRVDVDPAPLTPPPAGVQLAVYRILQEALTNALRHGAGAPVDVRLAWLLDRVDVSVRNGIGGDSAIKNPGHGIIGMRERAQLAGGRLDTASAGGEFVVSASLPLGVAA